MPAEPFVRVEALRLLVEVLRFAAPDFAEEAARFAVEAAFFAVAPDLFAVDEPERLIAEPAFFTVEPDDVREVAPDFLAVDVVFRDAAADFFAAPVPRAVVPVLFAALVFFAALPVFAALRVEDVLPAAVLRAAVVVFEVRPPAAAFLAAPVREAPADVAEDEREPAAFFAPPVAFRVFELLLAIVPPGRSS